MWTLFLQLPPENFFIIEIRISLQMVPQTNLNFYCFTSSTPIFSPDKTVIRIFIEIH